MNKSRRKELDALREQLEEIRGSLEDLMAEEEEYRDNIPENLQGSERYENAEIACERMSGAIDDIESAVSYIEEAIGE